MDGFLIIDKPAGWTSHDVVARVRRVAGQKRVGHTGTLDPDATGVLLVCLGSATRLIEYTDDFRKAYRAILALGVETDSQDASGSVTAQHDASAVTDADLQSVLPRFRGPITQIPPMVSAVHHEGKRLYDLARQGITVERKPRAITIHELHAHDYVPGMVARATLDVVCSAGTYVRTLCADIGDALSVGGHMESLRRTAVGPFAEVDAIPLESLEAPLSTGIVRPATDLLPPGWPAVICDDAMTVELAHGRSVKVQGDGDRAIAISNGNLLAVLRRDGDAWRPTKVFTIPEALP